MKIEDLFEWGRIVKGVNTTVDVGPDEIKKQAKKFGNVVDKDGRPQTTSRTTKTKSTNVLYNLGLGESTVHEIEKSDNISKDEVSTFDFDEYLDAASPTGIKIKGYEIWKADDVDKDIIELALLVKDPEDEGFLGEFLLVSQRTDHDKFVYSQVMFTPQIQGKGIAPSLYAYAIKKLGYTIVSDKTQTKGSQSLWAKLANAQGIFVYAWSQKHDKFFQWEPDLDPEDEVYVDNNAKDELYADLKRTQIDIAKQVSDGEIDQDQGDDLLAKKTKDIKQQIAGLETVRLDKVRLVATADNTKRMTESRITECPRTKSSKCQCERVMNITENNEVITASCVLEMSDTVKGTILFKQTPGQPTLIVGKVTGLTPGKHGFHIHEFGDLSNGCESAGGHYNPDNVAHGDIVKGHVGDLGNIDADDQGVADIEIIAKRVDLSGERSVVGRSIVIHSEEDDLGKGGNSESRKTGNAGDRLACGVITLKDNGA